ncbi:MAG TPA: hypothetical protein VGO45_01305 [Bacteroidia bacterium]|jgi:hypothetical protein|nr:hypothetical protein [Bacteroidia bacterium]
MKKYFLGLALAFGFGSSFAGNSITDCDDNGSQVGSKASNHLMYKTGASSYDASLVFRIGIMSCDIQHVNDLAQSTYGKQFSYNLPLAGISYYRPLPIRGHGAVDLNIDYSYLIPQTLSAGTAYSNRLTGFSAALGAGTDLFPKNKGFDLIISAGFQGGRLKYKTVYGSSTVPDQSNYKYFFAPQLVLYPRFIFGSLSLGLRASYHFDVLGGAWNGPNPTALALSPSQATGYALELAVAYMFGH